MKYSKIKNRSIPAISFALLFVSSVTFWIFVRTIAFNEGHFVDEITYHQAALNFFSSLNYTANDFPQPFSGRISAGILVTWPAYFGWNFFEDLYHVRLFITAMVWIVAIIVGTFGLQKLLNARPLAAAAITSCSTVLLTRLPYFKGFVLNLGELLAFLLILYAILIKDRYPRATYILLGCITFLGKFLFAPITFSVFVWLLLEREQKASTLHKVALFLSPVLFWAVLMTVRFGFEPLSNWVAQYSQVVGYFFNRGTAVESLVDAVPFSKRFQTLEWAHYSSGWKFFTLFFSLFSAVYSLLLLPKQRTGKSLVLFGVANILVYSAWYFLWHPKMFIRHFQPGLLVGFTLLVTLSLYGYKNKTGSLTRYVRNATLAFLVLVSVHQVTKVKQVWNEKKTAPTYATVCKDVFSEACSTHFKD